MALESYSELNFIGEEEKIIRMENEEITKEENERIEEGDLCKKIWPSLQIFFDDIPTYQGKGKLSGCANPETIKAVRESEANIADKKEKERTINFPFVCEKIIIGYLHKNINSEEMQKAIKEKLIKDRLIKAEDNIKVEIQQASPYDDRMEGTDAFLVVKRLNENKEELIKAIPIQITTAIAQDVLQKKMQQTEKNQGILLTVKAGTVRLLVEKYLEYYNSFIKKEENSSMINEALLKINDKELKNKIKSELVPPWDYFESQDIVRNDDLEKIKKEGEEIKQQFFYGMKERL
ncbi:MAG TPA: hypothetical protein PK119_00750 [Candidatus Paceibacterota bacterium]|nr:hypothetical protein [Candidatus Paceibacterota bacterium]